VAENIYDITMVTNNNYGLHLTFDYDIADLNFKSEIRTYNNVFIAAFAIVKDVATQSLVMSLDDSVINGIPKGYWNNSNYLSYDLMQLDTLGDDYKTQVMKGQVVVMSGVTQW